MKNLSSRTNKLISNNKINRNKSFQGQKPFSLEGISEDVGSMSEKVAYTYLLSGHLYRVVNDLCNRNDTKKFITSIDAMESMLIPYLDPTYMNSNIKLNKLNIENRFKKYQIKFRLLILLLARLGMLPSKDLGVYTVGVVKL